MLRNSPTHTPLVLAFALWFITHAPGQQQTGAFASVEDALLRGDRKEAARLLDAMGVPAPRTSGRDAVVARIALLRAGTAEAPDRIGRFLAVAAAYPARDEGLTALIAALHQTHMHIKERASLAPFERPDPLASEDGPNALATHLASSRSLLTPWQASNGDDPRVAEAARLLESAAATGAPIKPDALILKSTDRLPIVTPLAEPLVVRWYARPSGVALIDRRISEGTAPVLLEQRIEPGTRTPALPTPPAGSYALEVRSPSGWRIVRRVTLTDLDLAIQAVPAGLAILATLDGKSVPGVRIEAREPTTQAPLLGQGSTDADGIAIVPLSVNQNVRVNAVLHTPDGGVHRRRVSVRTPTTPSTRSWWTAHVMVDRPLYRPGETVRGRVVVRRHGSTATKVAIGELSTPATTPAANLKLELVTTLPGNKKSTTKLVTDGFGVATFETEVPSSSALGSIRYEFKRGKTSIKSCYPATVSAYKRPPLLLNLEGPPSWSPGTPAPRATVRATWPWGTPASGLSCTVRTSLSGHVHERRFALDAEGGASIDLDLPGLDDLKPGTRVSSSVTVLAADGQVIRKDWALSIKTATPGAANATRTDTSRVTVSVPRGPITAGQSASVTITGPAGAHLLMTVLRETLVEAHAIVLSPEGRADVKIKTDAQWAPGVTICASAPLPLCPSERPWRPLRSHQAQLDVRPANTAITVTLETDKATYEPGEDAAWSIVTRDASGSPVAATIAVAVVDDTLFQLSRDRTRHPRGSLRPPWLPVAVRHAYSAQRHDPWRALTEVLWGGLVPPSEFEEALTEDAIGLGGGAGSSFGRRGGGGKSAATMRKDFRTVAHWSANLRTDAKGRARLSFPFPDDLTTWRVTIAAIDSGRGGALHLERVRTERPIATESVLPRLMREGDRLKVPVQVAQKSGDRFDAKVVATAAGGAAVEDDPFVLRTRPGKSVTRPVTIAATGTGKNGEPAVFSTVVSRAPNGVPLDRAARKLPIISRDVERTTAQTAMVRGTAELRAPVLDGMRPLGVEVEILGSLDAVLDSASRYLTGYPWGCAEQTTSRLVPIAVAAHTRLSRRRSGEARLDPRQAHRLEVGMARLRELQRADGGFAWWDGQKTDPAVSAIVLRTLALFREAQIDPAAYRVRLDPESKLLKQASEACVGQRGDDIGPFPGGSLDLLLGPGHVPGSSEYRRALAAADLAVTRALIADEPTDAMKAPLSKIFARAESLPLGLIARAGRACMATGLSLEAASLLETVRERIESTGGLGAGPGIDESRSVRAAHALELVLAVTPKDALKDRMLAEILRLNRAGRIGHTAGSAASLIALARLRALEPSSFAGPADGLEITVSYETDDGKSILMEESFGPDEQFSGSWRFDGVVGPINIASPAGRLVVATVVGRFATDGTTVEPWSTPIRLTRHLARVTRDAFGKETLEPIRDGRVAVGDLLEVRLDITGPPDARYLLAECPLPAGFEALRHHRGVVIHDHRVARGVSSLRGGKRTVTFRMIPGLAGRVSWPAARIEAMYRPEHTGGTSGGWLTVDARRELSGEAGGATLLGSEWTKSRLDMLVGEIRATSNHRGVAAKISAIAKIPDSAAHAWIFDAAPQRLGSHLLVNRVMESWLRALGPAVAERMSGTNLDALFTATDLPPNRLVRACALGFKRTNQTFHERRGVEEQTVLERRVYVLAHLIAGSWPEHVGTAPDARARLLAAWMTARDVPESARKEAIRERLPAVADLEGGGPIARAFSALVNTRWRHLHHGHDAGAPKDARSAALALASATVSAFKNGDPERRYRLAMALRGLRDSLTWPETGAMEPREHAELRAEVASLLASLREPALEALMAAPEVASPEKNGRIEDHSDRKAIAALLSLAIGQDSKRAIEITRRLLPDFAQRGAIDAGRILLAEIKTVKGRAALRPLLQGILSTGPRNWWQLAWNALTLPDRDAVPDDVVMSELRREDSAGAAVKAAIRRPTCRDQLIAALPRLEAAEQRSVLSKLDWKAAELHPLGLEAMLGLREALESAAPSLRRRLTGALRTGPWQAEIVSRLARPADPGDRAWLLRAAPPGSAIAWDRDADAAADFWRTLHRSREGDGTAEETVRRWIEEGEFHGLPDHEQHIMWWALEPHLAAMDLVHANDLASALPADVIRRTLRRASTDELIAILQGTIDEDSDVDGRDVLERLPKSAAARIVDAAIGLWGPEISDSGRKACKAVLSQTSDHTLVAALARRVATLPESRALEILRWWDREPVMFEFASRAVHVHPSAKVRRESAQELFDASGVPRRWTDADGIVHLIGPDNVTQHTRALSLRLKRSGTRALTDALSSDDPKVRAAARIVMARFGLSTP